LLTLKRARAYAFVLAFTYVFAWCLVVFQGQPPLSSANEPIGGDYVAFYAAGQILRSGDGPHLYDRATVTAVQDVALNGRIPNFYDAFRNPPFLALVFAPLAAFDLLSSLALWSVLSLACLALAVWLLADLVPTLRARRWSLALVVFAFAPLYFGLIDGQNATLSMLLYVLIYRSLVRGEDKAAGVWSALGLFKPQLFFVFPLVFIASRRWRALAAYVVTVAVLAGVSFAVVGRDGLNGWLRILLDVETNNALKNAWRMHSLKAFFDLLLPGQTVASLVFYAATGTGLLVLLWRAWARRGNDLALLWILTTLVAVLVNPHLVDYDLTVLVAAGVLAASVMPELRWCIVFMYPLLLFRAQLPLGDSALQMTVPLMLFCALYTWRRLDGRATTVPFLSGSAERTRDIAVAISTAAATSFSTAGIIMNRWSRKKYGR
jgi:hypothetical protein